MSRNSDHTAELERQLADCQQALIEMGRIATARWEVACDLVEALREIDGRVDGGISTIKGRAALAAYDALLHNDGCNHDLIPAVDPHHAPWCRRCKAYVVGAHIDG